MQTDRYIITGMHCAGCAAAVEKATAQLPGVTKSTVNLAASTLDISYDSQLVTPQMIIDAVEKKGFKAQQYLPERTNNEDKNTSRQRNLLICSISVCLPLIYLALSPLLELPHPFSTIQSAIIQAVLVTTIIILNFPTYVRGLKTLFHFAPGMDTLVSLGSLTAFSYSCYLTISFYNHPEQLANLCFDSAGLVVTLVAVGKYLEKRAVGKTRQSLNQLLALTPDQAILLKNNQQLTVRASTLKTGDLILVKPGSVIPADGVITKGHSAVNEALITGESLPVEKAPGSQVIGGTINQEGVIYIEVTTTGKNSTLAQIIRFIEEAQSQKAPIARLADKIAAIFVPAIIIIALMAAGGWYMAGQDWSFIIRVFTSVLVIACPCALGLATPTAITVGTGLGAANGILIRNGEALEIASQVTTVVFDKTGTLTKGKPEIASVVPHDTNDEELLRAALSAEELSNHPLAEPIVNTARQRGLQAIKVRDNHIIPGQGISASTEEGQILVGRAGLLTANGINISPVSAEAASIEQTGATLVYVAKNNRLLGYIALRDELRPDCLQAIKKLRQLGKKIILLSGDNHLAANYIGRQAGIEEIIAAASPEDKAKIITKFEEAGQIVLMVGDGLNDAPALTQATLGCSLASASAIAQNSSQIILVNNELTAVAKTLQLSRYTIRNIKQNLAWAFGYNLLGLPLAAGLLYPLTGQLFSPIFGAAAMSLSSLCVVLNALRLGRKKL